MLVNCKLRRVHHDFVLYYISYYTTVDVCVSGPPRHWTLNSEQGDALTWIILIIVGFDYARTFWTGADKKIVWIPTYYWYSIHYCTYFVHIITSNSGPTGKQACSFDLWPLFTRYINALNNYLPADIRESIRSVTITKSKQRITPSDKK